MSSVAGYMELLVDNKWWIFLFDRIAQDEPPFCYVGVEYFGPFDIKRGRNLVKIYGVIFTCLMIRVIHIDVASSLDIDSFINAL